MFAAGPDGGGRDDCHSTCVTCVATGLVSIDEVSTKRAVPKTQRCTDSFNWAEQWHTNNVLGNRALDADVGSDGQSTYCVDSVGFNGNVAETVANNPVAAVIQDRADTEIGGVA